MVLQKTVERWAEMILRGIDEEKKNSVDIAFKTSGI